ncbi:hypothetical protein BDV93DRAFT_611386 [Ceratobasidium sp. AG-I]|nr:hypothetical protein BDV93DRAFT_611386 [Ceratobasidium sp. AG-I]
MLRFGPVFTELEGAIPTEQDWSDEEIVEQVRAEMQQAEADARGETLHDNDDDTEGASVDKPSNTTDATPPKPLSSHDDVLATLHALRGYVSHLDDPRTAATLSLIHDLSHLASRSLTPRN